MQYLLAHDLGTSGDKASLFTVDGTLVKSVVASYPCSYGSGNCVEQNPEAWYAAVCRTTQSLASLVDPARIAGVSFSGHMMGAVLLDGTAQGASRQTFYARARFGHCPQRGGLLAHLTCREHLTLLATIRASRPGTRDNRDSSSSNSSSASSGDFFRDVAGLERAFGLAVRAGQRAGTLSGGTRRRLCAAMALLDGTRVAVLDEPSTGMDVRARRALWARVRAQCNGCSSSSKGGAVVLTTHAVEEAERVCTRLGVLVRGRLAHVGTVQQLRAALGAGCVVTVVVRADCPADRRDHCALLQAAAPEVRALPVVRPNACTLAYCTGPVASIAALFRTLESAVNDPSNPIVDDTVTQATLETALAHLFDSSDVDSP